MNKIRNPVTTKTTDTLEVRVTDQNYVPINAKTENIKVTTNNAYPISRATVSQSNPQPAREATFTLEFYPEHQIEPKGGIFVAYPPQTTPTEDNFLEATISISDLQVNMTQVNMRYDLSARAVVIDNII